ncbi:MAG: cysteine desulfurase [Bacteroidota bacterium]|nr:cysteine desulfurase [Bacteroidota bacterium]
MKRIYFDNAATTRINDEVLDAMLPYLRESYGNPSSIHSFGKANKVLLEDARDTVAEFIGADPKEIFFTASGTGANNFALKGIAFNFLNTGKNHIISTTIEHSAVLDTLKYLEQKFNVSVTYLKPDSKGKISLEDLYSNITDGTYLISIMHSNNEVGIMNDIKGVSEIVKGKNIFVHSDSVQSIGKTVFNVKEIGINFATLSAHKFYGPKGIGVLYIKDKTPVDKFIHGGQQERNMQGGTENIPAIAGLKKAIELVKINFDEDVRHYGVLKNYLIRSLNKAYGENVLFNSSEQYSLPNIVNFSFNTNKLSFDEEMLIIRLDLAGIAVSGGSACTAGTHKPSYVLTELGRDKISAMGSLRISFSRDNTTEEIDYFMMSLKKIVQ